MDVVDAGLSSSQRRVLEAVKRLDEATADELAEVLQVSSSAVRQHLSALRSAGFVNARQDRGQPGRPADRYSATERAESVFAMADTDLSIELLEYIDAEDPALVERIFERRRRRLVDSAQQRLDGATLSEQVHVVTELLDAQGYLADYEALGDDTFRITFHNCPIWGVASRFGQACSSELDFMRELIPDARVERTSHKTGGSHSCAYGISPVASGFDPNEE
ncbi:MAG: helix-turn-helix transcriptional regulator [Ilumatobacter sp.]|uniref:helix-turn-helix transcriptional regulator n=1 Tax=Ilumatobacter sp. TaxID=1967498 RepID=UPI00391911B3